MAETIIAKPRDYEDLIVALQDQMQRLGVGVNQLDEICGLGDHYASKVLGPSRTKRLGLMLLWVLLPELGLRIEIVEDAELLARRRIPGQIYAKKQARFGNQSQPPGKHVIRRVLGHIGKIGGKNRMRQMSKKELFAHQQAASMARWVKRRGKRQTRVVSHSGDTSPAAAPQSR